MNLALKNVGDEVQENVGQFMPTKFKDHTVYGI